MDYMILEIMSIFYLWHRTMILLCFSVKEPIHFIMSQKLVKNARICIQMIHGNVCVVNTCFLWYFLKLFSELQNLPYFINLKMNDFFLKKMLYSVLVLKILIKYVFCQCDKSNMDLKLQLVESVGILWCKETI